MKPSEKKFEAFLEKELKNFDYESIKKEEYDKKYCLIPKEVILFIKNTQGKKFEALEKIYGIETEKKILLRIASEIEKRGVLDVFKKKIKDRGQYLDLCYFKPNSDLNPDHQELYKKNNFSLVRQLYFSEKTNESIDMGIFLNGLPIATIELKNQLTGQDIIDSQKQYKRRNPNEKIFKFKRCVVHFCVDNNSVSMTTRIRGEETFFFPFNKELINPPVKEGYRAKYFWEEILYPDSLLDILENFVHLSQAKEFIFNAKTEKIDVKTKEELIFPRYHQIDLIRKFRKTLEIDGAGKYYLVQHATGSGKSFSIGWLSHTLTSLYQQKTDAKRIFDSIIVVSDRKVLDDQLRNTIFNLSPSRGIVNEKKLNASKLKDEIEKGKDIIVATLQSFPFITEKISSLEHKKFAVVIDEVHSSQSGELSKKLKQSLTLTDLDNEEFDYEKMVIEEIKKRGKQKHISFFGFTGTPKQKTLELFGNKNSEGEFVPFHTYSMYQSINEGFTLDVLKNYTTFRRYFKIKQLNETDKIIPTNKGVLAVIRYVDSHPSSIKNKVEIILDHWINKGSKEMQGNSRGIIIAPSRKHCIWYSKEITKQLLEKGLDYRCLVAFSGDVFDKGKKYNESICNSDVGFKGDIPLGLKNPKYRLLIVANKYQTGFDEPLLQSMYVDKKLEGVQCIQTLSRLNRAMRGKNKTFILDFVNEENDIRESFQRFYKSTILQGESDPNGLYDVEREIREFNIYSDENIDEFCKVFYNPKRNEGELHPPLDRAVDIFKEKLNDENKELFRSMIKTYISMYGYLSQIVNFSDIELEKTFIFLKFLNKKLPKGQRDIFTVSDSIELESLRIQKVYETIQELAEVDSFINPPTFIPTLNSQPNLNFLSEIINQVNDIYGSELTEEDRVDISLISKKIDEDAKMKKFMKGNNSELDKKNYFIEKCNEIILDNVDERLDFYKKMDENPKIKDSIFNLLFKNYQLNVKNT